MRLTDKEGTKAKEVTEEDPEYLEVYAIGAKGGRFGIYDFRMTFYDSKIANDGDGQLTVVNINKCTVKLSYPAAKQLSDWLIKHLDDFEKESQQKIYIGAEKPEPKTEI